MFQQYCMPTAHRTRTILSLLDSLVIALRDSRHLPIQKMKRWRLMTSGNHMVSNITLRPKLISLYKSACLRFAYNRLICRAFKDNVQFSFIPLHPLLAYQIHYSLLYGQIKWLHTHTQIQGNPVVKGAYCVVCYSPTYTCSCTFGPTIPNFFYNWLLSILVRHVLTNFITKFHHAWRHGCTVAPPQCCHCTVWGVCVWIYMYMYVCVHACVCELETEREILDVHLLMCKCDHTWLLHFHTLAHCLHFQGTSVSSRTLLGISMQCWWYQALHTSHSAILSPSSSSKQQEQLKVYRLGVPGTNTFMLTNQRKAGKATFFQTICQVLPYRPVIILDCARVVTIADIVRKCYGKDSTI